MVSLLSLPHELIHHALSFLSAADVARAVCVSDVLHNLAGSRAAELAVLVNQFPRMPAILRHAAANGVRLPTNIINLHSEQQAINAGAPRQLTLNANELEIGGADELLFTVELYNGNDFAGVWSGALTALLSHHGANDAGGSRLWSARPAFINELNALNYTDPDEAMRRWHQLQCRVLVSRGLRTFKIYEAGNDLGDGADWSYFEYETLGEWQSAGQEASANAEISDDGVVNFCLTATLNYDDDDAQPIALANAEQLFRCHLPW